MTLKEFFDKWLYREDYHIFIGNQYDTTEFEGEASELNFYLNSKTEQYEVTEFDFYLSLMKYPTLAIFVNIKK